MKWLRNTLLLLFFCLNLTISSFAEILSLKTYNANDGLPDNSVYKIIQDNHGFVWIATYDGIARFDGYDFTVFSQPNGLSSKRINDIIQAKDGTFWIATQNGIVHFNPEGFPHEKPISNTEATNYSETPMFVTYTPEGDERTKSMTKILEDSSGTIWAGGLRGLFQIDVNQKPFSLKSIEIGLPQEMTDRRIVYEIYEDSYKTLWIGSYSGLFRYFPNGEFHLFQEPKVFSSDNSYRVVYQLSENKLLVGTSREGLLELRIDTGKTKPQFIQQIKQKNDTIIDWISDIEKKSENEFWLATDNGLYSFNPNESGEKAITKLNTNAKRRLELINTVYKSPSGTMWIGSKQQGISKVTSNQWTLFGENEKIETIRGIFNQTNGNVGFVGFITSEDKKNNGETTYKWQIGSFDGDNFSWGKPNLPADLIDFGWGDKQISFQASKGEWWIATGKGLYHFPVANEINELANVSPKAVYNEQNGLNPENVFRIFEDSKGNIWISTNAKALSSIFRWKKDTGILENLSARTDFPIDRSKIFTAFREDKAGNMWIGVNQSAILRYKNDKFQLFTEAEGIPKGWIKDLLLDQKGRIWIASTIGGASRIEEPNADQLTLTNYKKSNDLSSDNVNCLVEDQAGFIYFTTDKGIDRLNVETGKIKHFSTAQGVPRDEFKTAHLAKDGSLWFGMANGLLRYKPQVETPNDISKILITAIEIEGKPQKVSAVGTEKFSLPDLSPEENQVRVSFTNITETPDSNLSYQYKFANENEWSQPFKERFVNFANLSSGNYQITFRAVNSDDVISPNIAEISFRILPPIYLRWWFLLLSALIIGLVIWQFYRFRVRRLLEIERTRTRIATDLHDDIGADLSKISLLSEVVKMQMTNGNEDNNRLLTKIAETSRNSVDSMRDIVWAINPSLDSINDLVKKMRQFAEETLVEKNIKLSFNAPNENQKLKLSMDTRRELYLIFKEAVNNASKYADCSEVKIDFEVIGKEISLKINDNGKGFDISQEFEGNGLKNMKQRAEKLKGTFEIDSTQGTKIFVKFPQ